MKLIIDIDDDKYNMFCKDVYEVHTRPYTIQDIFRNGIPLDKLRAEIKAYQSDAFYPDDVMMNKKVVLEIIDKYKAESEPQERSDKE